MHCIGAQNVRRVTNISLYEGHKMERTFNFVGVVVSHTIFFKQVNGVRISGIKFVERIC